MVILDVGTTMKILYLLVAEMLRHSSLENQGSRDYFFHGYHQSVTSLGLEKHNKWERT